MTITKKMLLLIVLSSAVSSILVGFAAHYVASNILATKLRSGYQDRLTLLKFKLETRINELGDNATTWGSHWSMGEIPTGDEDLQIAAFIEGIKKSYPLVKNVSVFNTESKLITSTNLDSVKASAANAASQQALQQTIAAVISTGKVQTHISANAAENFIVVPAKNIVKGNALIGAMHIEIDRSVLDKILLENNEGRTLEEKVNTYFSMRDDEIFSCKDADTVNFKDLAGVLDRMQAGFQSLELINRRYVVVTDQLKTTLTGLNGELKLTLLQPEELAFRSLSELLTYITIIAAGMMLLFISLGFVFASSVGKPIAQLKAVTEEILESGDLSRRVHILSNDEISALGLSFNHLLQDLQQKRAQIEEYNKGLEIMVEDRTRIIRTILNNVKSGFLLVDSKINIMEGFTKSCQELFGTQLESGMPLTTALKLNERAAEHLRVLLEQVFDDILPEEASLGQMPGRFTVDTKSLDLQGSVVRGDTGQVVSILFTVSDSTRLVETENLAAINGVLVNVMSQREAFVVFLQDTKVQLAKAAVCQDPKHQRAMLHTIKGNASIFGLRSIAELVHHLEDKTEIAQSDVLLIENALTLFLKTHVNLLGINLDALENETISVDSKQFAQLKHLLREASTKERMAANVTKWITDVHCLPAAALLGPLGATVRRLSENMGKDVALRVKGADVRLNPLRVGSVIQNLVHLVRNSLDHGIEPPHERGAKPTCGTISMGIEADDHEITITVRDDGRGLDIEKLKARAITAGLITAEEAKIINDKEAARLIFGPNVSTADQVTEISGRGIGMASLAAAVAAVDGSIDVASTYGQGTSITIRIPAMQQSTLAAA